MWRKNGEREMVLTAREESVYEDSGFCPENLDVYPRFLGKMGMS